MPRTFISYRRSDSSTISGRIYDHLVSVFGEPSIFKDVYDIPIGSDFRKVIEDNINACRAQLIVIGPTWLDTKAADGTRRLDDPDDAVRIEVESGLKCRDILMIPVLVSGATMPAPEQLPESMRDLSFRNAIFIRDDPDFRGDIANLIKVLRQLEVRENTSRWRRRTPYIGGLIVAVLALALVAAYVISHNAGTHIDVIVSNKTGTHVIVLVPTSVRNIDATLPPVTAVSATPGSAGAASPTPSPASTASATADVAGAASATPDVAGAIALIRQGDALQQQTDYPGALDRYTKAIALDPGNSEAYISRASVYATLGTNFDQAIQDAKTAIQLDPRNYWNYDELGKVYFAAEKYDLSVQAYNDALNLEANPSGFLGRGMAYHVLTDLPHALADLTKSIELDPSNPDAYAERGWTNYDAKQYKDAIADFSSVIEKNPQSSNAYIGRGQAYRESGDLTSALKDFTQALAIDPNSSEAYYQRGFTHQQNGDSDDARVDFNATLKIDPDYVAAYVQLARLILDAYNDADSALPLALKAVDLSEENLQAQIVLADVYYAQGNKESALAHYRRYAELAGSDADPTYLTRIHELEGA